MRITKRVIDRAVTGLAAVAVPLMPLLIRHHVLSPADAQDVGTLVLAAIGAYHGGATIQRRRGNPSVRENI